MTGLEGWLEQATRRLSKESAAQVRIEIQEHYELAREAATTRGAAADEADELALTALGDAKTANRQYRKVLLTSEEARLLGEGNWGARMICSRPWLKKVLPVVPATALLIAIVFFQTGSPAIARIAFAAALATGLLLAARFLPIYTPSRGRVFRWASWAVIVVMVALAFGSDALKMSWLLISCLWPAAWVEWKRSSIRRKLPVAKWPKHLYL